MSQQAIEKRNLSPTEHENRLESNREPTITDVVNDTTESIREYAKHRPEVAAIWCLGVGFVLGWKLKPW